MITAVPSINSQVHVGKKTPRNKTLLPETGRHLGWNEEHFITVSDFARNAPAVIRLEIARISRVLRRLTVDSDSYNEIVSVRHSLTKLIAEVEEIRAGVYKPHRIEPNRIGPHLIELLEGAILNISIEAAQLANHVPEESEDLEYAANRLDYIVKQMRRLA